jgi:arylsulfatase A-like enzyme
MRVIFGEADHSAEELDITRSVRRGNLKLHFNRLTEQHELFDLEHDPGEQQDMAPHRNALANELLAELARFEETPRRDAPAVGLSTEEREALERLGYGN